MKKVFFMITVTLLAFPLLASSFQVDGMVRSKAAYRFSQQDLPVQELLVDSTITHYGDKGALTIHPVAYLNPNKEAEFDLKEVYVDLYFDNLDLRIGKQTIIWGEAEGAFITDLVSPRWATKSSYAITSARINPFSKSVWITPAAWGAVAPTRTVQARTSLTPAVK